MEEETKVTIEQVREIGKEKILETMKEYSLNDDPEGKQATGIANWYEKVVKDEVDQKNGKIDFWGKAMVAGSNIVLAATQVLLVMKTMNFEVENIFDTTTKRTVVTAFLNKIFRR